MRNPKRKWQFEYWNFYINRIFKTCYWRGRYKHFGNWNTKGRTNGKYHLIKEYQE